MVRIFKTIEGAIHEIQEPQEDCWIAMTNPTATEIFEMSERFGIEVDDLRAPLDEEERSRIEVEDNYTLILVDVPMIEERNDKDWYGTIPLGIIVTKKMIFTVWQKKYITSEYCMKKLNGKNGVCWAKMFTVDIRFGAVQQGKKKTG